jgi:AcrR family transcriptional regulator
MPDATASVLPTRGRPRSADCDRAIVAAILGLLEEQGYAGLTMGGVAERPGVSTTTLYRRSSSKEDLVAGAWATLVADRPAADTGSFEGDLRAMLRRMVEHIGGDRGRLLLGLAGEIMRHPALAEAVRARLSMPIRHDIGTMLVRGKERHDIFPSLDIDVAIALLVGPLHYWLMSGETIDDGVTDTLVPMLLRALSADATTGQKSTTDYCVARTTCAPASISRAVRAYRINGARWRASPCSAETHLTRSLETDSKR